MANVTTCTKCGTLYEAGSDEQANDPNRICKGCSRSDAKIDEARGHLGAALMQMLPTDDQTIMQHVRDAYTLLGGNPLDHHAQREFLTRTEPSGTSSERELRNKLAEVEVSVNELADTVLVQSEALLKLTARVDELYEIKGR